VAVEVGAVGVGLVLLATVTAVAGVGPRFPLLRLLVARLPIPLPTLVTSTPLLGVEVGLVLLATVTATVVTAAVLVILLVLIVCGLC